MFFGVRALTQHRARMPCTRVHAHSGRRAAHASLELQRGDRVVPQPGERQRGGSRAGQVAAPPRALRGRVRACIVDEAARVLPNKDLWPPWKRADNSPRTFAQCFVQCFGFRV